MQTTRIIRMSIIACTAASALLTCQSTNRLLNVHIRYPALPEKITVSIIEEKSDPTVLGRLDIVAITQKYRNKGYAHVGNGSNSILENNPRDYAITPAIVNAVRESGANVLVYFTAMCGKGKEYYRLKRSDGMWGELKSVETESSCTILYIAFRDESALPANVLEAARVAMRTTMKRASGDEFDPDAAKVITLEAINAIRAKYPYTLAHEKCPQPSTIGGTSHVEKAFGNDIVGFLECTNGIGVKGYVLYPEKGKPRNEWKRMIDERYTAKGEISSRTISTPNNTTIMTESMSIAPDIIKRQFNNDTRIHAVACVYEGTDKGLGTMAYYDKTNACYRIEGIKWFGEAKKVRYLSLYQNNTLQSTTFFDLDEKPLRKRYFANGTMIKEELYENGKIVPGKPGK
jgi:hypothetical protein